MTSRYDVLKVVGEGAYGIVLQCRDKVSGEIVAIKRFRERVPPGDDAAGGEGGPAPAMLREVRVLRALRGHPHIVTLREAFTRRGKLYLVFEFMEKNLLEVLEETPAGLPPPLVRLYAFQLCRALEWCHRHGVAHRDVKPENLLVSPAAALLKLCDFGFARVLPGAGGGGGGGGGGGDKGGALTDYVATRWYRAPELLLGATDYSRAVDLWAVGCLVGELADGAALFAGDSEAEQLTLIQRCLGPLTSTQLELYLRNPRFARAPLPELHTRGVPVHARYADRLPKVAIHFMRALLHMDPRRRLSARECLDHAWFAGLLEVGARTHASTREHARARARSHANLPAALASAGVQRDGAAAARRSHA
jgi:cyclin-dependent kinase-like